MKIYKPRKRIALNIEAIEDAEIREILTELSTLQNGVQNLNNGFSTQVQAAEQEVQAMIDRMKTADQQFNEVLDSIKTQVQTLTNSAISYIQMSSKSLDKSQPKFRDSFIYLTKDALTNLSQLVDGLQNQVGGILNVQSDGTQSEINLDLKTNESINPNQTPQNLLVSAIRRRLANLLPMVMQTVEKLEPIISQAKTVNQNTEKIVGQLQEIMSSIPEAQTTVIEKTEAFSPDISEEEVSEAEGLEEKMNFEAPAKPGEATGTDLVETEEEIKEESGEPAPEEGIKEESGEPAPEEGIKEESGEPAPKEEKIEEEAPVEEEEAIIEEEEAPIEETTSENI